MQDQQFQKHVYGHYALEHLHEIYLFKTVVWYTQGRCNVERIFFVFAITLLLTFH